MTSSGCKETSKPMVVDAYIASFGNKDTSISYGSRYFMTSSGSKDTSKPREVDPVMTSLCSKDTS